MIKVKINYKDIPLIIVGEYEAGEERELYDDNLLGYPGSSETFEITSIYVSDSNIDIFDLFDKENIKSITELIFEEL